MKGLIVHILVFAIGLLNLPLYGQVELKSELDKDAMLIGGRLTINLDIVFEKPTDSTAIEWIVPNETWSGELEVLSMKIDSLTRSHASVVLTSFDTSYVAVPPFKAIVGNDTIRSEAHVVFVGYPSVDLLEEPKDVKEIIEITWTTWERIMYYKMYIFLGLILLFLLGILWWLWSKKRRKPSVQKTTKGPVLTPSDIAYQRLIALQNKDLFTKGLVKEHYIELSSIFRNYVEDRFEIPALEETTDQLIRSLKSSELHRGDLGKLKRILELSDMVKFAKAKPTVFDHERSMKDARSFIMNTKLGSAED